MLSFVRRNLFLLLIIPAIGIFMLISNNKIPEGQRKEQVPVDQPEPLKETAVASAVFVDVKGAVRHPGIYKITPDARVNDVIRLAGGFTEKADQKMVNLAQKVQDEMMILVPAVGDVQQVDTVSGSAGSAHSEKIRINYASPEEIETLNGIGPSKAQAIVQYREENGFFRSVEDLLEVPGIGVKTLENFRESLQVP